MWAIYADGGTRVVDGEIFAGWGVISRSPRGRICVMFGPVTTNKAHPAFSGARTHSNNTTKMTAMFEALSFLGPRSLAFVLARPMPRTRATGVSRSKICDTRSRQAAAHHATCVCGNLGNECADHVAVLGTFGRISSHNVVTRWIRHNFDTSVCFNGCNNICETLERSHHIRTNAWTFHQDRVWQWCFSPYHSSLCGFRVALRFLLSLNCSLTNK